MRAAMPGTFQTDRRAPGVLQELLQTEITLLTTERERDSTSFVFVISFSQTFFPTGEALGIVFQKERYKYM